ncbi:MAG: LysE family translocator [Paracoccaceae bacterium]|uniref:LysE family translocator n=1 Tax=Nonlabens ulvanivorans TaxID=906888 RepID=UPI00328F3B65
MTVAVGALTLFAVSQIGTPGPANMALMATGARFGLRRTIPFVAGVILGKQMIIWPIGFGLMNLATSVPVLFEALKYGSAAYIIWLAWRVANLRLTVDQDAKAPGFGAGFIVHPLNPKAWAIIVGGFTNFVAPGTSALYATATIAAVLLTCQILLHPLWTLGGHTLAKTLAGTRWEPYLMYCLAAATVASVLFVLFGGGA